MLIRPPVVREMRRNLWAGMTATPDDFMPTTAAPAGPVEHVPDDRLAALKTLGELHASGVLTEAEFQQEKARLLG